jgi:hypothetical protein
VKELRFELEPSEVVTAVAEYVARKHAVKGLYQTRLVVETRDGDTPQKFTLIFTPVAPALEEGGSR